MPPVLIGRAELEASLARARAVAAGYGDPRAGIHGPTSTAWALEREAIVFAGGGRAALLQLADPSVAYAIADHSTTKNDVIGRFRRTFEHIFTMAFGGIEDAFTAARRVHDVHRRIVGTIPIDVGAIAAGTRYHANDAASLRWVYATLIDTVVQVIELMRGRLPDDVRDPYIRSTHQFARLFGIPESMLCETWAEHDAYMAAMLTSGKIVVSPPARDMAAFLLGRGDGQKQNALGGWVERVTAALMPPKLRDDFGLRWTFADEAAVRVAVGIARPIYAVLPPQLRWLPAYNDARRRLAGRLPSPVSRFLERQLQSLAGLTTRPA
jgi:uncharacterized protein (DUF2236 family)